MKKSLLALILVVVCIIFTFTSYSLPRYALMTGAKCGYCHVNPTGGQLRNENGTSFGLDMLPLAAHKEDDFTLNPKLTDNITIGGDYRGQFIYLPSANSSDTVKGKTTFQAMTATLYGSIRLSKKISFYYKQDLINSVYGFPYSGPEVYGIAKILPNAGYIKAGIFSPDYGWRLDDHTSYTRGGDIGAIPGGYLNNGLFFIPNYKDIGIEAGISIEDFSITASILNGTGDVQPMDFSKDKAYTAKVQYMGKTSDDGLNFSLGASGYAYKSYSLGGFLAGFAYSDFVLYGEMDWTHDRLVSPPVITAANTSAAFVELDYRAIQGLWLTGRYDTFDPMNGLSNDDLTPTTNSVQKLIFGLEFFPYSFVELRPQYRHLIETPSKDNDEVLVQLHLWF